MRLPRAMRMKSRAEFARVCGAIIHLIQQHIGDVHFALGLADMSIQRVHHIGQWIGAIERHQFITLFREWRMEREGEIDLWELARHLDDIRDDAHGRDGYASGA